MKIGNYIKWIQFAITNLGTNSLFLGYEWLKFHKSNINWITSSITFDWCPDLCGHTIEHPPTPNHNFDNENTSPCNLEDHIEDRGRVFILDWNGYIQLRSNLKKPIEICSKMTTSIELAEKEYQQKKKLTFEQIIPEAYYDFKDVFNKNFFDKLPEWCS